MPTGLHKSGKIFEIILSVLKIVIVATAFFLWLLNRGYVVDILKYV